MLGIDPPIGDLLAINDRDFQDLFVRIMDDIGGDVGLRWLDRGRVESCALQKMDVAEFLIHPDPFHFFREREGKHMCSCAQLNYAPNIERNASELLKPRRQLSQVVAGKALP